MRWHCDLLGKGLLPKRMINALISYGWGCIKYMYHCHNINCDELSLEGSLLYLCF